MGGHELWLRLAELEDGGLVVEVSDPVRVFPEMDTVPEGERGRGLLVVTQLAEELGWFLRAEVGKTVRARLAAPPETPRLRPTSTRGGAAGAPATPPLPS